MGWLRLSVSRRHPPHPLVEPATPKSTPRVRLLSAAQRRHPIEPRRRGRPRRARRSPSRDAATAVDSRIDQRPKAPDFGSSRSAAASLGRLACWCAWWLKGRFAAMRKARASSRPSCPSCPSWLNRAAPPPRGLQVPATLLSAVPLVSLRPPYLSGHGQPLQPAWRGAARLCRTPPTLWTPHRPARPEKIEGGRRVQAGQRLRARRRPADRHRRARRGRRERASTTRCCSASPAPARPSPWPRSSRQTQRPALILAPNKTLAAQLYSEFKSLLPRQRGRVLRLLLRLLPARGLRPAHRHLHREGLVHQRADRPHAPLGDAGDPGARRRHHRRLGLAASTASARSRPTRP